LREITTDREVIAGSDDYNNKYAHTSVEAQVHTKPTHVFIALVEGDGSKFALGMKISRLTNGWTCHYWCVCDELFLKPYLGFVYHLLFWSLSLGFVVAW
jgi:hypothetical protein